MDDATVGSGEIQDAEVTASSESTPEKKTPEVSSDQAPEKAKTTEGEKSEDADSKESGVPYDRFKEVNDSKRALEEEIQSLKDKAEKFDRLRSDPSYAEGLASAAPAKDPRLAEAEKKLNEMGYVKKADAEAMVDERLKVQFEAARVADRFTELESDVDGSDGRPKFETEDMWKHMQTEGTLGVIDPMKAYELRYADELADFRAKQAKSTPQSESGAPSENRLGKDRASMLSDAKKTGDFSKLMRDTNVMRGLRKE